MRQKRASTKTAVVSFRIGNEAYNRLIESSDRAGVSTREWLEEAILNNRTRIVERSKPNADLRSLVTQVNRMGNNLNQVAHTLNSAQLAGKLARDECLQAIERLDHIRALLNETITYARQG
ncbi:plasmid mobilization protein [Nitrosomonas eutropha]|jgi:hypothetical protein|uniref:Mobilization protein MobC n=2 Tax=Nitrosomonas eutropha TaxID=916 RepID=A0ABX5M8I5_9PROT|nr:plasmid mobilization relaxosome protein MobC [Nitrosomonas eutropha]ABI60792.1 mobilisation protein [Nitrosomonas eutropha C91]PXV79103.1 mobilization protein MobC [Nitrosomonas eutropha]